MGTSEIVKAESSEKIPGQLEVSFLIFLTPSLTKQSNTRDSGTASSTTHQVTSAPGTTATGPVTLQAAQPACVGEEAVLGNARDRGTSSSVPISVLPGPQNGSGNLAPILAPTLWILDPSAKLLGQM